ncbi:hypothetical protein CVT24_000603 [Panaeolus cyanescens]|uniref:Uncharacterized protein n=1 Tax=Panaeolus cyanescens TaxID=181874 RepID=A0A409YDF8_9AGAR|nr:hypothetical protein CVT24_000603 [Panaeolus cyanescens]
MLFSTQFSPPSAPSIVLGNVDAPVINIASFVLTIPGSVYTSTPTGGGVLPSTSLATSTSQPANTQVGAVPSNPNPGVVIRSTVMQTLIPTSTPASLVATQTGAATGSIISQLTASDTPLISASTLSDATTQAPSISSSLVAGSFPSVILASTSHSTNARAGKIAGGVVGGIAFVCIILILVYYRIRRQKRYGLKLDPELDRASESRMSSDSPAIITPFPPVERPVSLPAKLTSNEAGAPVGQPLQPLRAVPYGMKPSEMRPIATSLPMQEAGPSRLGPTYVLPRAKHASSAEASTSSLQSSSSRRLGEQEVEGYNQALDPGPSSQPILMTQREAGGSRARLIPMGPRRAIDGGPLAVGTFGTDMGTLPPTY